MRDAILSRDGEIVVRQDKDAAPELRMRCRWGNLGYMRDTGRTREQTSPCSAFRSVYVIILFKRNVRTDLELILVAQPLQQTPGNALAQSGTLQPAQRQPHGRGLHVVQRVVHSLVL